MNASDAAPVQSALARSATTQERKRGTDRLSVERAHQRDASMPGESAGIGTIVALLLVAVASVLAAYVVMSQTPSKAAVCAKQNTLNESNTHAANVDCRIP